MAEESSLKQLSDEQLSAMDLFSDYPSALLDFATASCIIFMLIGIPGNLITVISLARYKKVRNATAIFIINMSVSDLLFCCVSLPVATHTLWTRKWLLGSFMCRFFPYAKFVLAGVSVFTVLAITINRYIMISYPRLYTKLYTSRNLSIQVACIWVSSIIGMLPTWFGVWGRFDMSLKNNFCGIVQDSNGNDSKIFFFIASFIIPLTTITICYTRIFLVVRKATANSRPRRNKPDSEDTSFATSTAERSPDSKNGNVRQQVDQPEHPRVQSLRPPSSGRVKVSITPDELSSASSISNFKFMRAINIRKSQLLNIAPTSKDKRLLTMISAIMVAFFVFHLPITIVNVLSETTYCAPTAIIWGYVLRYMTTCINPIIYVVMSNEYRKAYKKVMMPTFCKSLSGLPR